MPAKTPAPPTLYFDVEDDGPARTTSHPAYRRLCKAALFYSLDNTFAPFGSDAGADTLANLQRWYRSKRVRPVSEFITRCSSPISPRRARPS